MNDNSGQQELAMLHILYGASSAALNAFRAADNPSTNNSSSTSRRWSYVRKAR